MYPQVRTLLPELTDDALESCEEHHVADVLVAELAGMQPNAERLTPGPPSSMRMSPITWTRRNRTGSQGPRKLGPQTTSGHGGADAGAQEDRADPFRAAQRIEKGRRRDHLLNQITPTRPTGHSPVDRHFRRFRAATPRTSRFRSRSAGDTRDRGTRRPGTPVFLRPGRFDQEPAGLPSLDSRWYAREPSAPARHRPIE